MEHEWGAPSNARWWVLAVFSMFTALQGAQWGYVGPIGPLVQTTYGVSEDTVQFLLNYGPILYLLCSLPFAFWMDTPRGLRDSTRFACGLVLASSLLRLGCSGASMVSTACLHASFILNAAAGPVAMGAVTGLTELWFPFAERGTATAIAAEANVLGGALSSLAGPLIVTTGDPSQFFVYNIMYVALCGAAMLAALLYFPVSPPHPPSESAARRHASGGAMSLSAFWHHHVDLLRNGNFLLLCLACGITNGMSSAWGSTISLNSGGYVNTVGAGWIGFAQATGGNVGGIIAGWIVDRFHAHKAMLLITFATSCVFTLWFALLTQGAFPASWPSSSGAAATAQVYLTSIAAVVALNCSWPVFYDLSAEDAYPVPEATSLMMMTNVYNFGSLLLLFVPLDSAAAAFNWINVGTLFIFTVLLAVWYRPRRARAAIDASTGTQSKQSDVSESASAPLLTSSNPHRPGSTATE